MPKPKKTSTKEPVMLAYTNTEMNKATAKKTRTWIAFVIPGFETRRIVPIAFQERGGHLYTKKVRVTITEVAPSPTGKGRRNK